MTLLSIRVIQLKRELLATGFRSLLLIGVAFFLFYASHLFWQQREYTFYFIGFLFIVCASIQLSRQDKTFIYTHLRHPHLEIFIEYLVLVLPFTFSSLFTPNWYYFPILVGALSLLPFYRQTYSQQAYFKSMSNVLPAYYFEWISGFRKMFLFLIPVYFLALAFSWFKILPLFLLWLLTVSIVTFYTECEPLHILRAGKLTAMQFVRQKLWRHARFLVLLYLPILLINTVFNFDYWLLNLLFIPVQLSLLCFAICFKYSSYEPNADLAANNMIVSLVSLGSVLPYLLPIPLIMSFVHYRKAVRNLKNYLHD